MGSGFQRLLACLVLVLAAAPSIALAQQAGAQAEPPTAITQDNAAAPVATVIQAGRPGSPIRYPDRAMESGIHEGQVEVSCALNPDGGLSQCEVTGETPQGFGFGTAALLGVQRARVRIPENQPVPPNARMRVTVRFVSPEPEPPLTRLEDPDWAMSPRPAFPGAARRRGVTTASVRLDCRSMEGTLRLRDCAVIEESHPELGFGAAAIRSARDASLSPSPMYNLGPETRVVFTVAFQDPMPR